MEKDARKLLSEDSRKTLRQEFELLRDDVTVFVFTDKTINKPFCEFTVKLMTELAEVSEKIHPVYAGLKDEVAQKYSVTRVPTLLLQPDKYSVRLTGAPASEEARTLLQAIIMASSGMSILSDAAKIRLADLKEERRIKVFVSPSCPYCPQQASVAIAAAIEKPGLISTEIIEIYENKDLAKKYNAFSVPQTYIDDNLVGSGMQPEEVFIEEVVTAAQVKPGPFAHGGLTEVDLVIAGAGPAGLTAAIYAGRSGLRSVVIDKANIGGQVSITPVVENYPGFTKIAGKTLMDMMAQQAVRYCDVHEGEDVLEVQNKNGQFEVVTTSARYKTKAFLITAGAEARRLGVPGEKEFQGRGVSYCAVCDGFFFKDGKKVIVVGGGNTAATEALYLKNIGVDVTIVHRKESLRAEAYLQQNIMDNKIPVRWNTEVREIKGDKSVTSVVLENTVDKSGETLTVDGVFIAIGYEPNNYLAKSLGVETDLEGYIKVDPFYRTSVAGVYAAGDITGGMKQIVTAVSQGAVAANTIFEDVSNPYWTKKEQN